jgi:hypothetical protein
VAASPGCGRRHFATKVAQATYTCRAVTGVTEENIRGTMLILNSGGQLLLALPMMK